MPIGFIDFDNAHAGSRLEDLGYASWLWIDIGNDDLSADLQGRRIADFFWSYGSDSVYAVDSILDAQAALHNGAKVSGVRRWSNDCRAWVERNRAALIAAITARSNNRMQPTRYG
jgi:hypothetical protein